MPSLRLVLDGQDRICRFRKLIMAGYTGRDQAEVQAHIEELKAHGIPAPDRIPTLYACSPDLLTASDEIWVLGNHTSGEAEFVLIPDEEGTLVGVGSDHTDRKLEESDIPRAKQICTKIVSLEVWRLADVLDHWDELVLRSWVGSEDRPQDAWDLYQEGTLTRMMTPHAILDIIRQSATEPVDDAVVFSGTLAAVAGYHREAAPVARSLRGREPKRPAAVFCAELKDPVRKRSLLRAYRVRLMDYLR